MSYTTPHAKQRFYERVNISGLPRKTKDKNKFIENYIKEAYKHGLTPNRISDKYLRDYMYSKMNQNEHLVTITKITHYKNNLFLFHNMKCVTILEIPKKAQDSVNNAIYITKLNQFINHLKENQVVKNWLYDRGKHVEKIIDLKKIICIYPDNLSYQYIINKFPLHAIKYIKNDSYLKKIIIKTHNKRKNNIKETYYFICALMLLIPKNQIRKLQTILKNNKKSFFNIIDNKEISKKQIDICYKQLYILLGGNLIPKYKKFKVNDNLCFDIINDYFECIIRDYILEIKKIFKQTL